MKLISRLNKNKVYYLASPYSHPDDMIKSKRYELVNKAGAMLCKKNFIIIEPIAMCHHKSLEYDLPTGYEYWQTRDRKFISLCDGGVLVLCLPGWQESVGVTDEVAYAKELGLPVYLVEPRELLSHKDLLTLAILVLEYQSVQLRETL